MIRDALTGFFLTFATAISLGLGLFAALDERDADVSIRPASASTLVSTSAASTATIPGDRLTGRSPEPAARGGTTGFYCTKVIDGDTFEVITDDHQSLTIRLHGVDAPELDQPFGTTAKYLASAFVFRNNLSYIDHGDDQHGQRVVEVIVNDRSFNLEMVKSGLAWCRVDSAPETRFTSAQDAARVAGRGLWADPQPIAPWRWRQSKQP